jgi:hypothetical protein
MSPFLAMTLFWQVWMRAMCNPFPAPKKAKPQETTND